MSEIKLLPCPFCGGEAMHFGGAGQHSIRCKKCFNTNEKLVSGNTYTAFATSEEAAKDWNTRKPMERIIEKLEEELKLSDIEKERCIKENPLQFDEAKGYSTGISNAIDFVKEEGGIE